MRKMDIKRLQGQSGFTLIELVIVIVIIGILAAVAIPNFTSLTGDAKKAKADAVGGALASWAGTNYARCSGKLTGAVAGNACTSANLVTAGFSTGAPDNASVTTASETACVVTVDGVASTPFAVKTAPASC